ncbi:hypothetical protein XBFM1_1260152 [Xenorhabdus bovienii str. feltiae Moldova]|uniref:Uncharacterized protein n=1 Tax=Xenorhabdus bovienii str. feltiae Moldova TaxID=1398200 RepID=A0A077NNK8_XENBV|nr:hypothetical protein XBFM1_1260152 [Xenorhabdus bovienii str. feltiae Moldova]
MVPLVYHVSHFVDFGQDAYSMLIKHLPFLGEANASCGSVNKPGSQAFLQPGNALPSSRPRYPEFLGSHCETVGISDSYKH